MTYAKKKYPLVVIVGPTASGKSSLAVDLAERFDGEIICADSRSVYIGADIGTAKPSKADLARVVHHGIDIVGPGGRFTAANFKDYANKKIEDIRSRGKIPFLVGGTGLYIDAVIFDFSFVNVVNIEKRQELEKLPLEELYSYCIKNNITLPENYKNKRYVISAIERFGKKPQKLLTPVEDCIVVGIATDKVELLNRIKTRSEQFFDNNVVNESIRLANDYGWNSEIMKSNIYKLTKDYLDGVIDLSELKQKNIKADLKLVKKQLTWFKRNKFIEWLTLEPAYDFLSFELAKYK
jgi:tRNA dimethylallyltransferase